MTIDKIIEYCNSNPEHLPDWYDKLNYKLEELNKLSNRISIYMIVCIIGYYLVSNSIASSVQISVFTFTDLTIVPKLMPLLFSYLILKLLVLSNSRAEVLKVLKYLSLATYKQGLTAKDFKINYFNDFTRILLPYSFWLELQKLFNTETKVVDVVGYLLAIPVLIIYIIPLYFQWMITKSAIYNFWNDDLTRYAIVGSVWINTYSLFCMIKGTILTLKENKQESFTI